MRKEQSFGFSPYGSSCGAVCTSVPAARALGWPRTSPGLRTNRTPTARGGLAVPGCAPLTLSKGTQCFRVTLTQAVLPC